MAEKEKEEGKNIHIVFADETLRPASEIDDEDRDQESIDREKIYDDEISPIVTQLIAKCQEHKMPLFLECEYNPGDFCKTHIAPKEFNPHAVFYTFEAISQCIQSGGVNIDKYFMWVIKQVKEAGGHGSIYLSQLGYRAETGEYDWSLRRNMSIGAKPAKLDDED